MTVSIGSGLTSCSGGDEPAATRSGSESVSTTASPGSPTSRPGTAPPSTIDPSVPLRSPTTRPNPSTGPPGASTTSPEPEFSTPPPYTPGPPIPKPSPRVTDPTHPTSPTGPKVLPNVGGPTVDSRHPNTSNGHRIPWSGPSSSPHCILMYNSSRPQPIKIISVGFHVDSPASTDAGPLQFNTRNGDENCGWLNNAPRNTTGDREPTCAGVTLGPHTGEPFTGPGCVLRLDFTAADSNVDRIGHFTFVLQTTCVDDDVDPCDRLSPAPTHSHPVTVQWQPSPFYVAACGRDAPKETEDDAAKGVCVNEAAPPSTSPSPGDASPSQSPDSEGGSSSQSPVTAARLGAAAASAAS